MKDRNQDRHDRDKTVMSWRVKPEEKALALLTAELANCGSLVEVYQLGLRDLATRHGILKNGEVAEEYKAVLDVYASQIRRQTAKKRSHK